MNTLFSEANERTAIGGEAIDFPAGETIRRVDTFDWRNLSKELDEQGSAVLLAS